MNDSKTDDFEFTSKHGFSYSVDKPNVITNLTHEMKYQVTCGRRRVTTHIISVWLLGTIERCQMNLELLIQELNEEELNETYPVVFSLLPKRIDIKVNFENGDHLITGFNGTIKEATKYYVGKEFNIGCFEEDKMVKATTIERIYARKDIKLPIVQIHQPNFPNPHSIDGKWEKITLKNNEVGYVFDLFEDDKNEDNQIEIRQMFDVIAWR